MDCLNYLAPTYFIFSPDVPDLLYYSHLISIFATLLIGFFVFLKNRDDLAARVLIAIAISFSLWTFIDLITWTNIDTDIIIFVWSFFGILYAATCAFSLYFVYVFIDKNDISIGKKTILSLLFLPIVIFAPTNLNLSELNLPLCGITNEGYLYNNYYYAFGFLMFTWTLFVLINRYRKATKENRKQILILGVGVELFLFSFFFTGYISTFFVENFFSLDFYSLFAMTFFMGVLAYMIVRYKAFNIKLIATQALIISLTLLIATQYLYITKTSALVLTTVTLVFAVVFGYLLIQSVRREVKQREQIEQLASGLEQANDQLKVLDKMKSEFVSIASHQLRSPLTAIRGYSSMLLEGSFGPLPQKAKEAIDHINESSRFMASSVEDYLNVSRIQAGNMKYEYSDFNVCDLASRVADDTRPVALKKGLLLTFKSDMHKKGIVHADIGKTRQVIDNLINNSLKYTPKGSINILVHDDVKQKKVFVDVSDTGIGMNPHALDNMFGKFERASNANEVNVTGTGLGLYIARKMAREMGGDVYATSEGEGKGSTFTIELPLMM